MCLLILVGFAFQADGLIASGLLVSNNSATQARGQKIPKCLTCFSLCLGANVWVCCSGPGRPRGPAASVLEGGWRPRVWDWPDSKPQKY